MRRLNLHRPATDTGLIKIAAFVIAMICIVLTGAFDCHIEFFRVGFC
jgi:hypothetical protein